MLGSFGCLLAPPPASAWQMPVAAGALPASAYTARTIVRDQGRLNSCTGFAYGAALNIMSKMGLVASPLGLYWYFRRASGFGPSQDVGAYMEPAALALGTVGVGSEALHPYDPARLATEPAGAWRDQARDHRVATWYRALSVGAARTALAAGLPVVVGFAVPPSFDQVGASGMWTDGGGAALGGHATVICGYDDPTQTFTVLNSWGSTWGGGHPQANTERGYFALPYSAFPGQRFMDAVVLQTFDLQAGG